MLTTVEFLQIYRYTYIYIYRDIQYIQLYIYIYVYIHRLKEPVSMVEFCAETQALLDAKSCHHHC